MKILIAIPVYNEELILEKNCLSLLNYCQNFFTNDNFKIVIADNNSNDNTSIISQKLSTDHYEINYLFLPDKGKGLAWKKSFLNNEADIYLFMDADLAVDLSALKPLIENIKNGADLVLGSRFLKNSKVNRSLNRKIISMLWNILAKIILKTKITDLSCGFKAINQKVKENIISLIKDNSFFARKNWQYSLN